MSPRQINREGYLEANGAIVLSDLEELIAKARIQAAISFLDSPDTAREPAHLRGITAIDLTGALHDLEAA